MDINRLLNPSYEHLLRNGDKVLLYTDLYMNHSAVYKNNVLYYKKQPCDDLNHYISKRRKSGCFDYRHILIKRQRSWYILRNNNIHKITYKRYPVNKYFIPGDIVMLKVPINLTLLTYDHTDKTLCYNNNKYTDVARAMYFVYNSSQLSRYCIIRQGKYICLDSLVPEYDLDL